MCFVGQIMFFSDLISVVVPVYNVEQYLPNCLDSIKSQTYKNLEIILVDDGSTDNSGKIIDSFKKTDDRVIVIHKCNGGQSDARNVGIERATGKYITFIDSDDHVSDDYVEYLYNLIKSTNADISTCNHNDSTNSFESCRNSSPKVTLFDSTQVLEEMFYSKSKGLQFVTWGKLYPLSYFSKIKFPKGKYLEDLITTFRLVNKSSKVVYGDQICYYYLMREGSTMRKALKHNLDHVIDAIEQISSELPKNNENLLKAFASGTFGNIGMVILMSSSVEELKKLKVLPIVKKYRAIVLKNPKSSFRVRVYAMLSYLGLSYMRMILKLIHVIVVFKRDILHKLKR